MAEQQLTYADYQAANGVKFPLTLLLENVKSAQNVGAIFRIADTLGAESLLLCGKTMRPPHRHLGRAARGSERHVAYQYFAETRVAIAAYRARGYTVVALEITQNSQDLKTVDFARMGKVLLIVGSEESGITESVLEVVDLAVHIPTHGFCLSLNVATALGIAVYEITKNLNPEIKPLP